jgi:hypothetical protein
MTLLLMSPVALRVVQVLKDYHAAELALVDADAADGFASTPIPADGLHYFDWDQKNIPEYPACSIRGVSTTPRDVKPDGFGGRVDGSHRLDVMFHARIDNIPGGSAPKDLQKLLERYVAAAVRILADKKNGLETIGNPTRWGSPGVTTIATWSEPATYGPEASQDDGAIVRTATLPIDVRRIEAR